MANLRGQIKLEDQAKGKGSTGLLDDRALDQINN